MSRITRSTLGLAATTVLISGALIAPAAAPAKSVNIKMNIKKLKLGAGGNFTSTGTGTFGKVKVSGNVVPPNVTWKFKAKGGTIIAKSTNAKSISGGVGGTLKFTGTGKYKKLKATGKFKLKLGSFTTTITGKGTY